ncbi:hypothetical protein D3C86_1676540 [compost metagenome]
MLHYITGYEIEVFGAHKQHFGIIVYAQWPLVVILQQLQKLLKSFILGLYNCIMLQVLFAALRLHHGKKGTQQVTQHRFIRCRGQCFVMHDLTEFSHALKTEIFGQDNVGTIVVKGV